jgi:hypothetical protein
MIRSNVRVCGRLALAATLSWFLIPVAIAEEPPAPTVVETSTQTTPSPDAANSDTGSEAQSTGESSSEAPAESSSDSSEVSASPSDDTATAAPAEGAAKNLNTVPEDGMGSDALWSGSTRIVHEILQKRPNEDVVICIGGCVEKMDRVVYAQAAEPAAMKPGAAVTAAAPSADALAPVKASEPANSPAPINGAKPIAVSSEELQPALSVAAKALMHSETATPEFVPAMAQPNVAAPAGKPVVNSPAPQAN